MRILARAFLIFLLCAGIADAQTVAPGQRPHAGTPFSRLTETPATQVNPRGFLQSPLFQNPLIPQNAYVFNNNPAYLSHFTACLAKVKRGTASCNVIWVGDSVLTGAYSSALDWTTYSIPSIVSYTMQQNGIPTEMNNSMGFSIYTADPRIAFPSGSTGWSCGSSPDVFGGVYCENNANSNPITFTPIVPVDTFTIYYVDQFTTGSVCTIQIDGTTVGTITVGGTTGYLNATFTAPLGLHTLSFFKSSGGECLIAGIDSYDSSVKQVHNLNAAWNGSTIGNWGSTTNPYSYLNGLATFSPALTIIMPGINDWVAQTDVNSYKASMQKIINTAKATGDVIIITSNPSQIGSQSLAVQQRYVTADYQVALANNIPVIDTWSLGGSWESMNTLGLEENALHLNGPGAEFFAGLVSNVLLGAAGPSAFYPTPDRVTAANFVSSSATVANVTGLSFNVAAGAVYRFKAVLHVTADATGGHKYAVGGTATATSLIAQVSSVDNGTNANIIDTRLTSLGSTAGQAGATTAFTTIEGTIDVNAAGTVTIQFGENSAVNSATLLAGSTLQFERL